MAGLLEKLLIKDGQTVSDPSVRERYGTAAGVFGIICNILLFSLKLVAGLITSSVAVMSDAFNNLTDCGSSIVTILGAKLSNKRPDREHPFGHGRYEYISELVVAMIIIIVGVQLALNSAEKIANPGEVKFSYLALGILTASVIVKLIMFFVVRSMGKKISSGTLIASSQDSINDAVATAVVIVSTILHRFIDFPFDGVVGVAVSLFVIFSGIGIAKDTVGELLGRAPTKELSEKLLSYLRGQPGVIGTHDLIIHDYGPGRSMASVHAEVPDTININKIHETIDEAEQRIYAETGIITVIHMDPVAVNDPETELHKANVRRVLNEIDSGISFHDFRFVRGENRINLIFDIIATTGSRAGGNAKLKAEIAEKLSKIDERYHAVVTVDVDYT